MEIGFIGGAYQDKSLNLDAQVCQNLSIVVDQQGGKSILSLEGIPGGLSWINLGFYNGISTHYQVNLKGKFFQNSSIDNRIVVLTSLGSTFNRGDFTATNAFFWSSLDLSPYDGTDLGSTPYYIEVLDGAGKKATGYMGAVGEGETLGSEKITNGSFSVDTANWTGGRGTLASIVGGQSGNCLEITDVAGEPYAKTGTIVPDVGKLYIVSFYVKSGTSGNQGFNGYVGNLGFTISYGIQTGTTSASWIPVSFSFVGPSVNILFVLGKTTDTAGLTMLFDEASIKQVLTPPSTAVHIVSSVNGTTRNWASIESGFDPNTITSWGIFEAT